MESETFLERAQKYLYRMASKDNLLEEHIRVTAGPISTEKAIGQPTRRDFPLLTGKEVIVEAEFRGNFGQAFTSEPLQYESSLDDILKLSLIKVGHRAILLSTLNAVASYLKIVDRVIHCKNEEPEKCAEHMAQELHKSFGLLKIGIIGLQPAILEHTVSVFGAERIRCTDLSNNNIDTIKFGVDIWDGSVETSRLIDWCDLVLVTGSALANNTFDDIYQKAYLNKKKFITFGITGAAIAAIFGLERMCFYGH